MKNRFKGKKRISSMAIALLTCVSMVMNTQAASLVSSFGKENQENPAPIPAVEDQMQADVYNPIAPAVTSEGTADPSIVYHDGYYYYVKMRNSSEIVIYKSPDLHSIATGECKVIFSKQEADLNGLNPVSLWAPELQYVEKTGKWYVYFTAEEKGRNHRMYALEGQDSPDKPFRYHGYMEGQTNDWQIDGVVVEKRNNPEDPSDNQLYFVSSIIQRRDELGDVQDLGLYEMEDPLSFKEGSLKIISKPTYDWERLGTGDSALSVNEGPEVLYRDGKTYLVYSASTCWSRHYKLGMLTIDDQADFTEVSNWVKSDQPVFTESEENGAYGVGHHCFVYNDDTNEDFIVYHGFQSIPDSRAYAAHNRDVRMQPFTWKEDGTPDFGVPTNYTTPIGQSKLTEFQDDFEQEDFHSRWITYGGDWNLENGQAVSSDKVLGSKMLLKDSVFADFTLEADLTASSVGEEGGGLLFRTSLAYPAPDAQCGYYFGINVKTKKAVLGKFADNWQMMSSASLEIKEGQTCHVKIVANGANITVYIDDMKTPVLKAVDTQYRQGSVGIRAFGAQVNADNFSVVSNKLDSSALQTAFEPGAAYKIVNFNSQKVIGLAGGGSENGTNVVQQTDRNAPYQQWRIMEGKDGFYKIVNVANGKLLGVTASSTANANVHLWEDDNSAGELWKIDGNGDGTCKIKAQCSGKVLDVDGFSKQDGANISQYHDMMTANQKFSLVRVSEEEESYTNPVALDQEYPDPYIYYHETDGYYYGMATNIQEDGSSSKLYLYKSRNMTDVFASGQRQLIAQPEPGHSIWAPEIHFIDGKWYVYYSGGMRGYVLENQNADPMSGTWVNKGKIFADGYENTEQIDGTVLKQNGKWYYIWCLWKVPEKDPEDTMTRQTVVISEMENPWILKGDITVLSESEFDWESVGSNGVPEIDSKTNEGPAVLQHEGKTFVTYSGSYCHTQFYRMGMLSCDSSADPMDINNWTKSQEPVFQRNVDNGIWSTGHNSFTVSPDGNEAYLVYHGSITNQNDDKRYPFIQKISFDSNGQPVFGEPDGRYRMLDKPASAEEKNFTVNVAQGKTAIASSTSHDSKPEWAVDGDRNFTKWVADGSDMPQWLNVDLGDTYYVGSVYSVFEQAAKYEFMLEYSLDGENWKTFADYSQNTEIIEAKKMDGSAIARYVRVRFTAESGQSYWASIRELEVYGAKIPVLLSVTVNAVSYEEVVLSETISVDFGENIIREVPVIWETDQVSHEKPGIYQVNGTIAETEIPVTASIIVTDKDLNENIALHKNMTASSSAVGHGPELAADGKEDSRWAADGPSLPQWLMVDLEDLYYVNDITTVFENKGVYQYILEYSMDQREWNTYADCSTNTLSKQAYQDEGGAKARYVRIRVSSGAGGWASILEFQVHGAKIGKIAALPAVQGYVEEEITLPETACVTFWGGTQREVPITWEANPVIYKEAGTYEITGSLKGSDIPVLVTVQVGKPQSYQISGKVAAGNTGIPVAGIPVSLYRMTGNSADTLPSASTVTDGSGNYVFDKVAAGIYKVKIQKSDKYHEAVREVTVANGSVTAPTIILEPVTKPTDKRALQAAYDAGKSRKSADYEKAGWDIFAQAMKNAGDVLLNKEASQGMVDAALSALQRAEGGLKKKQPAPPKVPTKNQVYKSGSLYVKVTKSASKNGTVEVVRPAKKTYTSISIPKTVKLNGYTFQVTGIGKSAFKNNHKLKTVKIGDHVSKIATEAFSGCKKLHTVTIGKGLTSIERRAFYGAKSLKKLTINSTVLKKTGTQVFTGMNKKAVIDVPNKKKVSYRKLFKKAGLAASVKIK